MTRTEIICFPLMKNYAPVLFSDGIPDRKYYNNAPLLSCKYLKISIPRQPVGGNQAFGVTSIMNISITEILVGLCFFFFF